MALSFSLEWTQEQAGFFRFYARAAYQGDPALQETVVRPVAEALLGMLRGILANAQARGEVPAVEGEIVENTADAIAIRIPPSILDQTRELSVSIVNCT